MRRTLTTLGLILALTVSLCGSLARPAMTAPSSSAVDVVLLIDSSGSLTRNDPNLLSLTASRLLIDLLSPGDRISLIDYDTKATVLASLTAVNTQADRDALGSKLASVKSGGYADYTAALTAASDQLAKTPAQDRKRLVILLTDGHPDPGGKANDTAFMTQYLTGLTAAVAKLADQGCPLHTVAIGGNTDQALLRTMAVDTGGSYHRVMNPADIAGALASVIADAQGLTVSDEFARAVSTPPATDTFTVDASTKMLKVIATGRQGQPVELGLSQAAGAAPATDAIEQRTGSGYAVATVSNPQPGPWQISVTGGGDASISVFTDMGVRLEPVSPSAVRAPLSRPLALQARVTSTAPFTGKVVAQVYRPGATIPDAVALFDDGTHGDGAAGDGVYGGTWNGVTAEGDYRVRYEARIANALVAARSVQVYGEPTEILVPDSPAAGTHYRGERMILAAHFAKAGLPVAPGDVAGLSVRALVSVAGASPTQVVLSDDGNIVNGDAAANDGVYSAIYIPSQEGDYQISFVADGTLAGRTYHDELALQTMPVAKPVMVKATVPEKATRVAPGGSADVEVTLVSASKQDEPVEVSLLTGANLTATPILVTVPAGGKATAHLAIAASPEAKLGPSEIIILCKSRAGVSFDPPTLNAAIRFGRTSPVWTGLAGLVALLVGLIVIFIIYRTVGRSLFAAARRRARVEGTLSWSGVASGSCDLGAISASEISVGGAAARVSIGGVDAPILFRLRTHLITIGGPARLGWTSLSGQLAYGCEVAAEGDNRVVFRDFPKGLERLFDGDEFRCGDLVFRYDNPKLPPRPRRGA